MTYKEANMEQVDVSGLDHLVPTAALMIAHTRLRKIIHDIAEAKVEPPKTVHDRIFKGDEYLKRLQAEMRRAEILHGPYLLPSSEGPVIVIPSPEKNPRLISFCHRIGAQFYGTSLAWYRPVRKPFKGKTYSAQQWLDRVRERYGELWEGHDV
jgi:hypothetical protein